MKSVIRSAFVAAAAATAVLAFADPAPPVKKLALPGAPASGGVALDFVAADRGRHRVWVPAGGTGSVDVLDTTTDTFTRVEGFPTTEVEVRGTQRVMGPSSVTLSDGRAFIGNRADNSVCVVVLGVSPAGALAVAGTIPLEGEPEGYAVDENRGLFYTNLEDADRTLAIDVPTRKVVATWKPECGAGGPKGLVIDTASDVLVVACPDHVVALDAGHGGQRLGEAKVGAGIDNIDYVPARHEVFVAAGRDATLAIFQLSAKGGLEPVATERTTEGARTVVADGDGTAYVIDPREGGILVVRR